MRGIIFTIKDIINILLTRRENEFDGNLAATGDRGNGKSTVLGKIFFRLPGFKPNDDIVYGEEDAGRLLKTRRKKQVWDDEAINSSYKRTWQQSQQIEKIKILTNYRDSLNIYGSALPNFFSLDKDLRDLFFLHLFVIERGIAVVHMPLQGRLYSQDRWDAKNNAKIEESWSKKMQGNPNFKPPYHKLTTFKGYLFFGDLTKKQKALLKEIKSRKRGDHFNENNEVDVELTFMQKLFNALLEKRLTKEVILQMCLMEGKKYSHTTSILNRMIKDNGHEGTMKDYLKQSNSNELNSSHPDEILKLVPDLP